MPTIFLDHQSSTPVLPEALEAMTPFFLGYFGNPSSLHQLGLRSRDALAKARSQFAALIHAEKPEDIIFTSGGTESTNLAVKGVAWANRLRGKHIVLTAIEHPAVLNSIQFLEQQGFTATRVPVDREGVVDPEDIARVLTDETILVCVHHVNHDVGTVEPIRAIAEVTGRRGIPLFVDAVASAGWMPIDVQAMGISLLSLTAHRFYGPKGVGVLYRNRGVRMASIIHGGDQENARRAGTENVPAIVGGGVAAEAALGGLAERRAHTARLQKQLWHNVRTAVPYVALHGPQPGPKRVSTNLNISAEFTEGEGQLLSLDLAGVTVASGTSCVSKSVKVSHVLAALGVDRALAQASIILSLGKDNTEQEIENAVTVYARVIQRLRSMSPSWEEFQKELIDSVVQPRSTAPPQIQTVHEPASSSP
jgi:cysteine desulfurase